MPTGYTYPVAEGEVTDVSDFASACARAFGVFVHQRDDSPTAALRYPEAPEDSYYVTALADAQDELKRWQASSEEDKYAMWSEYAHKQTVQRHKSKADVAVKRARYESMLAQVHAIDVPSALQSFHNFMVDQLEQSIKHDCGNGNFENEYYRVLSYPEWCDTMNERVLRDVVYYDEQLNNTRKRYEDARRYIDTMAETFGFEVKE